jgi:hypothetical protein
VDQGLAQSAAVIMSARAQREGKKFYWDREAEEIVEHAPAAKPGVATSGATDRTL